MKERTYRSRPVRAAAALLATLALATVAACGGGGDGTTSSGGGPAEDADPIEAADRSGSFRFAISYGHNSLDPHQPVSPGDSIWMRPLYDGLLTLANGDDGVEVAPQLATSYEFSDDGLSLSLELRDDVTFQDGTPFDGEAVKANIERAKSDESTVASYIEAVESVEVVDPTHVVFHLAHPDPALPWTLADGTVGMMVNPAAFDTDLSSEPAGTGPYTLVSATKDADVVYQRWDDHWDPDAALAEELTISTISDGNARFNGVRSGNYEAAYMSSPHDIESEALQNEGFRWVQALGPISYGVNMNADKPPFDDVRVRRAVSMALDRPAISEELLGGLLPPSYQPFNQGYLGYDESLDENPYDPEAAAALVEEAGATGETVTIIQALTSPQDSLGEVVAQALGDIGLEVELVPMSPTESSSAWQEGGHHGYVGTIIRYSDPSQTLTRNHLGSLNPGTPPAELVTMAEEAMSLPEGSAEREQAYQEISAWLVENPVHVPIAQFSTVVLARPEVVGAHNMITLDIGKLDFRRVGVAGS